ncbi:MAG: YihY/virulence factor BrkB family protein [Terrimicrobiaceae bacterium]
MAIELLRVLNASWQVTAKTFRIYGEIDGEQRAASFAYYVLFSLFPMLTLILTVGSLFFDGSEIVRAVDGVIPLESSQRNALWEMVMALEASRGGVGLASAAILLWCSLRFFQALVRGVNRAWHTVEIPWWQMPIKNLAMLGIISSALFAGILIPAILQGVGQVLRYAGEFLKWHFPLADFHLAALILDASRYILGGAVLFYSFTLLYKLAPRRKVYFRQVWLAAVLVTVALQACQIVFVNIFPKFVNYGLYGAVGGMMLVLMWVYFSGIIIMLGGCLCAALDEVSGPRAVIPSTPGC